MSTYTSEPGTRLAGRYRLVDQVNEGAGWTYWKATDEALARSVSVLTFANGFPRIAATVTAARAVSRLGDPRFAQVFDVEDGEELAYVVLEWVASASLFDMLSEGPLDPPRAAALAVEAARAMMAAHAIGLAHLRLDPACLHWTAAGGVKIAGLGIDAALAGPALTAPAGDAENPQLTDTRDLARLLYAALTGYWPALTGSAGASAPGLLPPAPENGGVLCTPRQVSADIPAGVDDVTCRTLFQRASRHGPALSTATEFADALAEAAPPLPLLFGPAPPASQTSTQGYSYGQDNSTNQFPPPEGGPRHRPAGRSSGGGHKPPGGHSTAARAVISVVIVLVLVAVGVAAWSLSRSLHHSAAATPSQARSSSPSTAAATAVPLKPVSASVYNPAPNTSGDDDPGDASAAIDGDTGTAWHTSYYYSHLFGGLKPGAGLLLDMGRSVRLSQLTIQFGTTCCTHVQIELGNTGTVSQAALGTFTPVQSSASAANSTTFNVTSKATGRYVLIWITDLPPLAGQQGRYEALISNVAVRGLTVGQSG
ncbi:MAG TPA: protein kinase family protein [Streptosporangiaceae bacterium]|nr:protein kinase family protein [Streptosporangiaceae bacterium]